MEKFLNELVGILIPVAKKGLVTIIILFVGLKLVKFIMKKLKNGHFFNKLEKGTQTFVFSIISILLKAIVILTAVTELGIPMTSIITILGSLGLALGLALQGGLSNIAGGVIIMFFKPFKVGDFIDTHTDSGTVKEINIFHTILTTYDNKTIVLPNANLANTSIINYSKLNTRLLDLEVYVDYKSDIKLVKKILENLAKNNKYVLQDENVLIAIKEHSDNCLTFAFRVYVNSSDYWNCKFEMLEAIKLEFDKNNISIPYKQLDVHINK